MLRIITNLNQIGMLLAKGKVKNKIRKFFRTLYTDCKVKNGNSMKYKIIISKNKIQTLKKEVNI